MQYGLEKQILARHWKLHVLNMGVDYLQHWLNHILDFYLPAVFSNGLAQIFVNSVHEILMNIL